MSPLMVEQKVGSSLRLERRILVVATESIVARAMIFLWRRGAYMMLSIS
jgi:hypothetical protein